MASCDVLSLDAIVAIVAIVALESPMSIPSDLIDVAVVARILQVHVSAVYRWLERGRIVGYRIGGRWRLSRADVMAFVRRTGPDVYCINGKATGPPVDQVSHDDAMRLLRESGII
jgi:excisionase family DNA binding protein